MRLERTRLQEMLWRANQKLEAANEDLVFLRNELNTLRARNGMLEHHISEITQKADPLWIKSIENHNRLHGALNDRDAEINRLADMIIEIKQLRITDACRMHELREQNAELLAMMKKIVDLWDDPRNPAGAFDHVIHATAKSMCSKFKPKSGKGLSALLTDANKERD